MLARRRSTKATTTTWQMAPADSSAGGRTPLYDNLGSYHMAITTRSPVAQQYFDQGLRLTYGFNHDEAIKSYTRGHPRGLDLRDVLVGNRLRAGPQHQRADGHRGGAPGVGSAPAGGPARSAA